MVADPGTIDQLEVARRLHRTAGVVDLHLDSILWQRIFRYRLERRHRAGLRGQPCLGHADLPRVREAGYVGACFGVHYPPWQGVSAWREAWRQVDALDRLVAARPGELLRVTRPGDWARARDAGRMAVAPGFEGAHLLAGRLDRVAALAERGVAYLTLTHFSANRAAAPSMGLGSRPDAGLTDWGRRLVRALEDHRIAIDVAHVSAAGVLEVCRMAGRPVLVTHTGARAVHDHRRNLSDEAIDAVAATGGLIGVFCATNFLAGRRGVDSSVVVEHVLHLVGRVGARHVAIGTDYDGMIPIPIDQRDCRDLVRVTAGLLERGLGEDDVAAILSGNAIRVLDAG